MVERNDYSGPLDPNLKLTDFSKDVLIRLYRFGGTMYGSVDINYYNAIKKRYGEDIFAQIQHEAWYGERGAGDIENIVLARELGFSHLTDETAPMRISQLLPSLALKAKLRIEQLGKHDWIMWADECFVPDLGEKGGPEAMKYYCEEICWHIELFGFRDCARRWNPNIRVDPVALPPRESKDKPQCGWRYTLCDSPVDYAKDPGELVGKMGLKSKWDAELSDPKTAGIYHKKKK